MPHEACIIHYSGKYLVFTKAIYQRTDHYSPVKPVTWKFTKAMVELVKSDTAIFMAGNLQLYSSQTMEPEKPIYITLKKSATREQTKNLPDSFTDFTAYPNPFNGTLNLSFTIQNTAEVRVSVFNTVGIQVSQQSLGILQSGRCNNSLQLNVPDGTYILKLTSENGQISTIVVKQ